MLEHRPFLYRQFTVKSHTQNTEFSKIVFHSDRGDSVTIALKKMSLAVGETLEFVFFNSVPGYAIPYAIDSISVRDDNVRHVRFFDGSNLGGDINRNPGDNLLILPEKVYDRSGVRSGFMFSILPLWNYSALRG